MSNFSDFLFQSFVAWETEQPERRSSYRKFADWLSDNSLQIVISHSLLSQWINGKFEPSDKYHYVLIEKLGPEVANVLGIEAPDPLLQDITRHWSEIDDETKNKFANIISPYTTRKKRRGDTDELKPKTATNTS